MMKSQHSAVFSKEEDGYFEHTVVDKNIFTYQILGTSIFEIALLAVR